MFSNLTKEIILYSVIPVIVIILIDLIALLVMQKKEKKYRFNYFIKVSLIVANAIVLPLIGGYDIWIIESYLKKGIIESNIWYIALIIFLWICLFVLLIWVYLKSIREIKEDEQDKKELEKEEKEENAKENKESE